MSRNERVDAVLNETSKPTAIPKRGSSVGGGAYRS